MPHIVFPPELFTLAPDVTVGKVAGKTDGWCAGGSLHSSELSETRLLLELSTARAGPAPAIPAGKSARCSGPREGHRAFSVSRTPEIYEVLGFICNFNQGSLSWAFVSFVNVYPCNFNLISFANLYPPHPTIPNPFFVLRFSRKVKSVTFNFEGVEGGSVESLTYTWNYYSFLGCLGR